ncbi:hypothetical protein [Chelativorans sp. AA-79]|uniref:hypothetical protein n=1 Tax=Chelativorans sp. AA-79 TaxID=3028735 RepID=UPI0023F76EFF|nr:hypothetical protein [Chelativorans sp. AA-79]WEX10862.1 hypothetical protein PVE73_07985 [Chelativorans sp. AA-79]
MLRRRVSAFFAAGLLTLGAPQGAAGTGGFSVELNDAVDIEGGCRLVYVAFNGTGIALQKTSYDVFTFDPNGRVVQSLVFQFGSFPAGKTKVVQFDLPDQPCAEISRLLVNEATECVAEEGPSTLCIDALKTSTRVPIAFGL